MPPTPQRLLAIENPTAFVWGNMLERSPAARYALSVFFEQYNDFDVYIEDTAEGYPKIFATLLSRATSNHISLQRVFPLGSRPEVIKMAKLEKSQNLISRKSIFIVDGDLYLLCGECNEIPDNVITLPRYCIENFLVDQSAIENLLNEETPNSELIDIMRDFDYAGWITRYTPHIKKLFIIFAVSHKLGSGLTTVNNGSSSICENNYGEINIQKASEISKSISHQLIENYGWNEFSNTKTEIENRIDSSCCFISKYVSGKDFILPFMFMRARAITKTKTPNLLLKLRLANKCDVEPLREVVEKIGHIIQRRDLLG